MNETLIEFKNVSYSYLDNDEKAINDINLDIKKGEFISKGTNFGKFEF